MKASAEKSSATTSAAVIQAKSQPFFAKAGRGSFFPASVQARLMVEKPGDALEEEANAVAEQAVNRAGAAPVMRNKGADREEKDHLRRQPLADSITPFVQRQEEEPAGEAGEKDEVQTMLQPQAEEQEPVHAKFEKREEKEKPPVQAKAAEPAVPILNPATKSRLSETKGQGSPLSDSERAFMEAGFGIDFGHVRIHTGGTAVELCNDLRAQAFTQGSDIYFNEGKYHPASTDVQKLLAHELTHVVQQNRSKGVPPKPVGRKLVGKNALESVTVPVPPSSQPATSPVMPDTATSASAVPQAVSPAKTPIVPPDRKETDKGLPGEKEEAPGMEPSAIEPTKAPTRPKEDPDFQEAKKIIRNNARKQKSHEPATKKQAEMRAAAALEEDKQQEQSSQEQQTAALEEAAKPKKRFDRVSFKEKLKAKIEEKLPDTEDKAKAFPNSGKLEEAKSEFGQTITEEKGQVTGPLEKTAKIESLPPGQVTKKETPLPAARPADRPSKVPSQLAAPKPRTDQEISLQHESDNLDQLLAQGKITEQQLAESEEPQFEQALKKKQDAQREIAAAPARYREQEARVLEHAQQQTEKNTGRELQRMAIVKNKSLGSAGVHGSQTRKESKTEIRQREIKNTINDIYLRTEREVKTNLEQLSIFVQNKFNIEAMMANISFNRAVRGRLDDHYGWFTFDDKIAEAVGLSDGVVHIFLEEKQNFLNRMDKVLEDIATDVETELNRTLDRIQQGRKELDDFKTTLSTDELKFADDLVKEVEDKFTDLEATVEEQQEELLETLSDQYVENVNKLQEEFDKINEELGSSWIADAISFIGDVANAIRRLGALLMSIVERIAGQIDAILAAPKKFFATLVSGINQGIDKFTSNIGTYLEQGFWMWLTGASSARNIQVPEKMDPQGMFSLALQMVGIDKLFFLERIRVKLGKGVEKLIAGAQTAGEKLLEPVRILLDGGIGALWAWVKDEVSSHLQEIFTKIKEEIFEAIIKKALLWVASLFIPGLGFIRLIQAIYKALRWLVDNISRIEDMVNSFLDSIELAVQGNVGAIVNKVIKGLTLGVVIAIDFLAKLVGLGNFADKLQRAIQSLKKPVQKVIDLLLSKARPVVRKIQRAMQKVTKAAKKQIAKGVGAAKAGVAVVVQWWKAKKPFTNKAGEAHTLSFSGSNENAKLQISTKTMPLATYLKQKRTENKDNPEMLAKITLAEGIVNQKEVIFKQGTKTKEEKDFNQKVIAALAEISQVLMDLGGGDLTAKDYPDPQILSGGVPPNESKVEKQSNAKLKIGTPTSGNHGTHGWDYIESQKLSSLKGDKWVQMHLVSHTLGGNAVAGNLVPAPNSVNSAWRSGIENATSSLLAKKADSAKKPASVIWLTTKVSYFGEKVSGYQFANSVSTTAGLHLYKGKKSGVADFSEKGPSVFSMSAQVPWPDFTSSSKASLNTSSGTHLREKGGINANIVNDIKRNRPYSDKDNFEAKMLVNLKSRFPDTNSKDYKDAAKVIKAVKFNTNVVVDK